MRDEWVRYLRDFKTYLCVRNTRISASSNTQNGLIHHSLFHSGCEYGGYSSDITRTWPINGTFTSAQAILYDVILTLQKDLLATLLQHGGKTLDELFDTMCLKLGFYLQEVGLIPKTTSDMELARAAYSFCPHHVSHYLGMDIHDTPLIARTRHLIPGMVFTVEPGKFFVCPSISII